MDSHKELAGFIVDGISNPLDLFLERFVNLAQGFHGVLESPLCHLIRRHAFRQEIAARIHQMSLRSSVMRTLEQFPEDLMVNRDQFQQTLAFRDRATPKLVSLA